MKTTEVLQLILDDPIANQKLKENHLTAIRKAITMIEEPINLLTMSNIVRRLQVLIDDCQTDIASNLIDQPTLVTNMQTDLSQIALAKTILQGLNSSSPIFHNIFRE